jgi:hypothetical protein
MRLPDSEQTVWRLTASDTARLSKNESSCEKNQPGTPKPCPNHHITSTSHVLKLERGMNTTRLHKTPHILSFLRFTESSSKLSLTLSTSHYVTLTYLNVLLKWSRHFSLYLFSSYCAVLKRLAMPSDCPTSLPSILQFANSETSFTHGCYYPNFPGSLYPRSRVRSRPKPSDFSG